MSRSAFSLMQRINPMHGKLRTTVHQVVLSRRVVVSNAPRYKACRHHTLQMMHALRDTA